MEGKGGRKRKREGWKEHEREGGVEGKGGRRRKREGWKEHEREGGRVKREEPRRNCDSRLAEH